MALWLLKQYLNVVYSKDYIVHQPTLSIYALADMHSYLSTPRIGTTLKSLQIFSQIPNKITFPLLEECFYSVLPAF